MTAADTSAQVAPPPLAPETTALFLDLDGTLAEIVAEPSLVHPDHERTRILRALQEALGGGLAVLTGRTLTDADRILDAAVPAVAAVHGLVRRMPEGGVVAVRASERLAEARHALASLVAAAPGAMLEDKGWSVAVHYRQAPEAAAAVQRTASQIAEALGLRLQEGAMVCELRTEGPHKGDSLRAFLGEPPFAGRRPVMVGDDLTDEDAFAAAESLGGYGILVGAPRPTGARYRLSSVADVLGWLESGLRP